MGTVYSNPASFGYLPPALRNDFIKAGHNKYSFSKPQNDADQKVQVARGNAKKSKSTIRRIDTLGKRATKAAIRQGDAAVRAERPVAAAKVDQRAAVKAARKSGVKGSVKAARKAGRTAVAAARNDPNSARSERRAARPAKPTKPVVEKPGFQTPGGKGAKGDKGDPGDSGPNYDRNPDAKGPASRSPRDEQGNLKNKEAA